MTEPLRNAHPRFKVSVAESGEEVGARIRRLYKLEDYPLPSTVRVLEDFGVYVIALDTDAEVDGFAARHGQSRVVVLNTMLPPDRMRLSPHDAAPTVQHAGPLPVWMVVNHMVPCVVLTGCAEGGVRHELM